MGIITVSRTHGSGGTTFARQLAKRLDYLFINRTLISNDCRENSTHVCAFGIDDETTPGFHGATQELMTDVNFYKVSFIANILERALKNNAVLAGMGAAIVLGGIANTINIRVVRIMAERVKAIARVKNIPYDDAFDLVEKMDEGKQEFIARYFDADASDPSLYHAVINSSHVALEDAVDITASYASKHFASLHTKETETILRNRLLEKRAEILLFHLGMGHSYGKVAFHASDASLAVTGILRNEAEKNRLLETLKKNEEIGRIEETLETGVFAPVA